MRTWSVLLCALTSGALTSGALTSSAVASGARAEAPEQAPARGSVRLNSEATHYGTSFESVYQLNLEPSATFRLASFELSALLPLSSSATYPTYCCRIALGNATLTATQRNTTGGLRHWYELSVSLPSSRWSDEHASSLAATAALLHDAGYYLPDTTTLRAGLGAEVDVSPWLSLGASAAAHHWLAPDQSTNPLIVPLSASARLSWASAWSARATYRSLARLLDPLGPREHVLHELSATVAYAWSDSRLEGSLFVPLDESLRKLGMLSIGTTYVRSF